MCTILSPHSDFLKRPVTDSDTTGRDRSDKCLKNKNIGQNGDLNLSSFVASLVKCCKSLCVKV